MKYTIQGEEFKSKAALQRAWRIKFGEICKSKKYAAVRVNPHIKPSAKGRRKIEMCTEDKHWFIEVAYNFDTQRSRLYPDDVRDLECAKSATDVFIDNASIGFGSLFGGRVPKHLKKCVFFQDKNVPHKFRTVNAQLKDNDIKRDTKTAVTAWLRRSIQGQIDSFRANRRKSDNYKCFLCGCELAGQENHVDHGIGTDSFKSIAERFQCAQKSTPLELGELGGNLTKQWRRFHKKNANLTMTCRPCNLSNK